MRRHTQEMRENHQLIDKVEQIVLQLLTNLMVPRTQLGTLCEFNQTQISTISAKDNGFSPQYQYLDQEDEPLSQKLMYKRCKSRHRFCLTVYMLSVVHRLQLNGGSCSVRGLYYRDTVLIRSQKFIESAKLEVCRMLQTAPTCLGILSASKGLIAGDVRIFMSNGDLLDCNVYSGAISLPTDFESVESITTRAKFLLVVEKESVFESLLSHKVFDAFTTRFVLLTGKGYPDYCTRRIVHWLAVELSLPAYILVDADPFGIDIMLVYRHGSQAMSFISNRLATPTLRWLGLHPSEIATLSSCVNALSSWDNKKINDILARDIISQGVREELCALQRMQLKAEIESIIDVLSIDYIPNKIRRQLFL